MSKCETCKIKDMCYFDKNDTCKIIQTNRVAEVNFYCEHPKFIRRTVKNNDGQDKIQIFCGQDESFNSDIIELLSSCEDCEHKDCVVK